jgi:predicted Zn-dependent protease
VARDSAGSGYQVAAHYILTRDAALVQPLGTFRVSKPDQATGAISKEFQNAQKAFVAERNCVNRAREGKYAEAIAEAKKGIAAYPNTTLARICLANAMQEQKASPDSILAVTSEILRIDPKSKPALTVAYTALKAAKRPNDATDVLLKLVGADPSNTRLLEQVIEEFAINGQAAKAIPFVDQLVRDNPGEPNHLQLQMKIHLTAKDYKGGIAAGEELTKADTAAATPELFLRLIGAAQLAEMNDKALDLIRQAVGKYPNNVELLRTQVGMLVKAGKNAEALEAVRRALAANPKAPGLNTTLGTIFVSMNQPDSAVAAAQAALAAGDSASSVAPVLVAAGQAFLKASKTADDYRKPISVLELANKTSETPAGHLLLGQAQFSLGYAFYQDVQKLARSQSKGDRAAACEAAKGAQMAFGVAQIEIPAGGRASPQAAQQLLSNLGQLSPATDQAAKVLCAGK